MNGSDATPPKAQDSFSLKIHVIFASLVSLGLIFGVGGWAYTATLSGAIIAPGTFVVERNVKKVQHNFGGIVTENVRNGDRVQAGQILLKLDSTIGAELEIVRSQLLELRSRSARLAAERDGASTRSFFRQTSLPVARPPRRRWTARRGSFKRTGARATTRRSSFGCASDS